MRPPSDPAEVTQPAGYSGTPLPSKLGVRAGSRLLLVDAPTGFELHPLPPDVTVHRRAGRSPYDVVLVFCADSAALHRRFRPLTARLTPAGALWVGWPKRASGVPTDLDENVVRDHAWMSGSST